MYSTNVSLKMRVIHDFRLFCASFLPFGLISTAAETSRSHMHTHIHTCKRENQAHCARNFNCWYVLYINKAQKENPKTKSKKKEKRSQLFSNCHSAVVGVKTADRAVLSLIDKLFSSSGAADCLFGSPTECDITNNNKPICVVSNLYEPCCNMANFSVAS